MSFNFSTFKTLSLKLYVEYTNRVYCNFFNYVLCIIWIWIADFVPPSKNEQIIDIENTFWELAVFTKVRYRYILTKSDWLKKENKMVLYVLYVDFLHAFSFKCKCESSNTIVLVCLLLKLQLPIVVNSNPMTCNLGSTLYAFSYWGQFKNKIMF